MKRPAIIILLLLFVFPLCSSVRAAPSPPSVLLVYNTTEDQQAVTTSLAGMDVQLTSLQISDLTVNSISDQNLVIFASSLEFSTDDSIEATLLTYLQDTSHHFMLISPFFNEFSGELEKQIGINDSIELVGNATMQWTVTFDAVVGNNSIGDTISYEGITQLAELAPNAELLASFTGMDNSSEEDFTLPQPAIWNVSSQAPTTVLSMAISSASSQLGLDQLPFSTFLADLIQVTVNSLPPVTITGTTPGTTGQNNSTTNDTTSAATTSSNTSANGTGKSQSPSGSGLPSLPPPQFSLIAALLAVILLLFGQIMALARWLVRKGYSLMFLVVGAFYNISDRTLSHNEVMMNVSRNEIMAYLNHIGSYGAHLREIKSALGLGSGSLLWHLQMLEDFAMIEKFSVGSYTVFVAEGYNFDPALKKVELDLQSKYTLDVLDLLTHADTSLTLTEIEEHTGFSRRAIRRLVNKLAKHDLVSVEKYPEMAIEVTDANTIRDLYHSFDIRTSFDIEETGPNVDYMN